MTAGINDLRGHNSLTIGAVGHNRTAGGAGIVLLNSVLVSVTASRCNGAGAAAVLGIIGSVIVATVLGIIGSGIVTGAAAGRRCIGRYLGITTVVGANTTDEVVTGSGNHDLGQFLITDGTGFASNASFGAGCSSGFNLNSVSCQGQFLGMLVAAGLAGEGLGAMYSASGLNDLDLTVMVTQVQTTLLALVILDLVTGSNCFLAFDQIAALTLLVSSITVFGTRCFLTRHVLHIVAQRCGIFITDEVTALADRLGTALYGAGSLPLLDNFVMMTSCGNRASFRIFAAFALALISAPASRKTGRLSGDEVTQLQIVTQTGAIIVAILGIVTFGALNSGEILSIIAVCRSALFGFYQSVFMVTHMQTVNTGIHQICRSSRVHMMATGCNGFGTLMTAAFTLTGESLDTILKTGGISSNITHVVIMAKRIGDNLSLLHILADLTLLSSSGIADFASCGCCFRDVFIVVHTFSLAYGAYAILPGVAQAYTIMVAILGIVTNSALNSGEVFSIIAVSRSALFGFFQSVFVVALETANLTLVRNCRVVGMTQSIDNFTTTQDFIAIITHITASDTISYASCRSTDFPSLVLVGTINVASLALAIHNVVTQRSSIFKCRLNQNFLTGRTLGTCLDLGSGAVCGNFRNHFLGMTQSGDIQIASLGTALLSAAELATANIGTGRCFQGIDQILGIVAPGMLQSRNSLSLSGVTALALTGKGLYTSNAALCSSGNLTIVIVVIQISVGNQLTAGQVGVSTSRSGALYTGCLLGSSAGSRGLRNINRQMAQSVNIDLLGCITVLALIFDNTSISTGRCQHSVVNRFFIINMGSRINSNNLSLCTAALIIALINNFTSFGTSSSCAALFNPITALACCRCSKGDHADNEHQSQHHS